MEKSRDIVVTGIQAWDIEIGSNCKNIAIEMSKKHRVLYVNPPLDIFTYLKISNYDHIEWHMHKNEKNHSKNDLELYNSPEKLRLEWVLN